jgi:hypothetical protein
MVVRVEEADPDPAEVMVAARADLADRAAAEAEALEVEPEQEENKK